MPKQVRDMVGGERFSAFMGRPSSLKMAEFFKMTVCVILFGN